MITQDEAIALAREVGIHTISPEWSSLTHEELTALCNKVREQTLLEAAEKIRKLSGRSYEFDTSRIYASEELRRMAGVGGEATCSKSGHARRQCQDKKSGSGPRRPQRRTGGTERPKE